MKVVGLQTSIWSNNLKSILLLILFPILLMIVIYLVILAVSLTSGSKPSSTAIRNQAESSCFARDYRYGTAAYTNCVNTQITNLSDDYYVTHNPIKSSFELMQNLAIYIIAAVGMWFIVAWIFQKKMILALTHAEVLDRKSNERIYNLVENLCISRGLPLPQIYILPDDDLNAYASGLSKKDSYICLTKGLINSLTDQEIEAVTAHELTHIMNNDTKLMIISIIFVGIIQTIADVFIRVRFRSNDKKGSAGVIFLIQIVVFLIGFIFTTLIRLALSRKREFLADAGSVELTKSSEYMISALQKINGHSQIEVLKNRNVAQMFIENPFSHNDSSNFVSKLFSSHPTIEERITALKIVG